MRYADEYLSVGLTVIVLMRPHIIFPDYIIDFYERHFAAESPDQRPFAIVLNTGSGCVDMQTELTALKRPVHVTGYDVYLYMCVSEIPMESDVPYAKICPGYEYHYELWSNLPQVYAEALSSIGIPSCKAEEIVVHIIELMDVINRLIDEEIRDPWIFPNAYSNIVTTLSFEYFIQELHRIAEDMLNSIEDEHFCNEVRWEWARRNGIKKEIKLK
jgi:hypothetical protein